MFQTTSKENLALSKIVDIGKVQCHACVVMYNNSPVEHIHRSIHIVSPHVMSMFNCRNRVSVLAFMVFSTSASRHFALNVLSPLFMSGGSYRNAVRNSADESDY